MRTKIHYAIYIALAIAAIAAQWGELIAVLIGTTVAIELFLIRPIIKSNYTHLKGFLLRNGVILVQAAILIPITGSIWMGFIVLLITIDFIHSAIFTPQYSSFHSEKMIGAKVFFLGIFILMSQVEISDPSILWPSSFNPSILCYGTATLIQGIYYLNRKTQARRIVADVNFGIIAWLGVFY